MTTDKLYKIFSNIPKVKTERLLLRRITGNDASDIFEYSSIECVSRYLLWYAHPSLDYTEAYVKKITEDYKAGRYYDWGIQINTGEHKGKMIGTCGFTSFDIHNNSAEVGYVLNPSFWGLGYASEALEAVIKFGFEKLLLHRIEARFIIGNDKSLAVMQKCSMTFEGIRRSSMIVKGAYTDIGVCSILSNEYYKTKNQVKDLMIGDVYNVKNSDI